MATIFVDVVSAEESIFSGEASFVALPGQEGESISGERERKKAAAPVMT